jgi:c-di-GMP-binding flagellar brake protein YcgR
MSENHRKFERHEVKVYVTLSFLDNADKNVCTRDISEGGMFLEIADTANYPLGEMIHIKYSDPAHDNADTEIDAIIVRVANDGLAISFVEQDAF